MVRHFAGNQAISSVEEPFTGAIAGMAIGGASIVRSLFSSLVRSEAKVGVGAVVSGGANAARGG